MDYDVQLESIYVNGKETDEFPKKESGLDFEKIVCSNDANASFDSTNWSLTIGNLNKASSCKIYFNGTSNGINPPTGAFFNILFTISIIAFSVYFIRKVMKKNKFYKL